MFWRKKPKPIAHGRPRKLEDDSWGVRTESCLSEGDSITVTTGNGTRWETTVVEAESSDGTTYVYRTSGRSNERNKHDDTKAAKRKQGGGPRPLIDPVLAIVMVGIVWVTTLVVFVVTSNRVVDAINSQVGYLCR